PERRVADLPLLNPAERQQLLLDWNATDVVYPARLVHRWFEAQAAQTPDAIAVVFDRPATNDQRPTTTDKETRRQGDKETRITQHTTRNARPTTDYGL